MKISTGQKLGIVGLLTETYGIPWDTAIEIVDDICEYLEAPS